VAWKKAAAVSVKRTPKITKAMVSTALPKKTTGFMCAVIRSRARRGVMSCVMGP
jgi:hypothetical protein